LEAVLKEYQKPKAQGLPERAVHGMLAKTAAKERSQPLYNVSPFTFNKLLGDSDNIGRNLVSYIKSFAPKAQEIFEKFRQSIAIHSR
jgi:type I restriction enzyme M protein